MRSLCKTMGMGLVFLMSAGLVTAQQPQHGKGGPRMMGPPKGAPGGMRGMMFLMRFDKNQDLQIQEDELRAGLEKVAADYAKVHGILLQVFDENKNGKIDGAETKKIQDFLRVIMSSRMLDTDHDWQISEDELGRAWDKLAEQCQRYNEAMLKRNDKDQDGKLSAEEIKAAREQMKNRWQRGGQRAGGPGGRGDRRKKRDR